MMKGKKKIILLGFNFPGDDVEYINFLSNKSLMDADIVVCKPNYQIINYFIKQAKKSDSLLNDFLEDCRDHWITEFNEIASEGRTIIFYLDAPVKINDINESSYYFIPFIHPPSIASGSRMILSKNSDLINEYWDIFEKYSKYTAYFEKRQCPLHCDPLLFANSFNRIVAGVYNERQSTIIFLPPLNDDLFSYKAKKTKAWRDESDKFGKILANCFRNMDYYLQSANAKTKPPDWISDPEFALITLSDIENKIDDKNKNIEALRKDIKLLEISRTNEEKLLYLLYETGDYLEEAVIEALKILGFDAEKVMTEKEEYDVKFSGPEGRFIGEIEGKDNKSITKDKILQLIDRIEVDQENNKDGEYSKGVLFGNARRLRPPSEREDFFSKQCLQKAKKHSFVLVPTPDLFFIARYVKEQNDSEFAKQCREALLNSQGDIVTFLPIPNKKPAS